MRYIISTVMLLMFFGCSSGRKMSYVDLMKDAPEWAKRTPNTSGYYHGVGMATKGASQDFRERARQNALAEISGSISVTISSSSVLNQFEFDNTYSEYFRDNIRMSTQQQLEGFELVDNWENDQQYWVYYRLSKPKWTQVKQARIDKALATSISKYDQARLFGSEGKHADALRFYIRSVEDIRDFLGEDIQTEIDGIQRSYATSLMADLIAHVQQMKIMFPLDKLTLEPGATAGTVAIDATVVDRQNQPVSGVPVITRYSWLPGSITEKVTDAGGQFRISPQKIIARNKNEQIICALNLDRMVRDNTTDMMVQKLFDGVKVNTFVLPVELIKPVFYISVNAKNLREPYTGNNIEEELTRLLRQDGYQLTDIAASANYTIIVDAGTIEGNERNNRFSALLSANYLVKDDQGKTVFYKKEEGISGLGGSFFQAGEDAYRSLTGKIRITVFPEIVHQLFH
jgi:hypothetical protein